MARVSFPVGYRGHSILDPPNDHEALSAIGTLGVDHRPVRLELDAPREIIEAEFVDGKRIVAEVPTKSLSHRKRSSRAWDRMNETKSPDWIAMYASGYRTLILS